MNKTELIAHFNKINNEISDLVTDVTDLLAKAKTIERLVEELPDDASDIENDEDEE